MMKSVLQKEKECYLCGSELNLHRHHCLYGNTRKNAEEDGFTVWLCQEHHTGQSGVHMNPNKGLDLHLKQLAQKYYEYHISSHDCFVKRYGKSYL